MSTNYPIVNNLDLLGDRRRRYPRVLDETVARVTAGEVVVINSVALLTRQWWLLAVVAADYAIRAAVGPRFSPLAWLARAVARQLRLPSHLVAAAPKRFAATIGGSMMLLALTLALAGQPVAALAVGAVMVALPAVESFAGFCVGCAIFGLLMRWGVIPQSVCVECAAVTQRLRTPEPVR